MRDENNQLKFYDPQVGIEVGYDFLGRIKYKFDLTEEAIYPQILRVDDKKLNIKVLNQISKPARKTK